MIVETDFAGRQIIGSRDAQEDYYCFCLLDPVEDGLNGLLLVLADGMGGSAGGAIASQIVAAAFVEQFCCASGNIPERLLSSLQASERRVCEEIARREEHLSQMGSTLVAVVWTAGRLYWTSVGDSALYLYRNSQIRRLNADHSMVPILEAKAARGEISEKEAAQSPDRNMLRSAIAAEPPELYELRDLPFELRAGDIILAATDGLASISLEQLSAEMGAHAKEPADRIATSLLAAVSNVRKPKQDNATVAVIRNSVTSE